MVLILLENAILRVAFANTVCLKRTILILLESEFTDRALEIHTYPESTIWPTMVVPKKKLKKRLSDGWKMLSWDWLLRIQCFLREPFS